MPLMKLNKAINEAVRQQIEIGADIANDINIPSALRYDVIIGMSMLPGVTVHVDNGNVWVEVK